MGLLRRYAFEMSGESCLDNRVNRAVAPMCRALCWKLRLVASRVCVALFFRSISLGVR